MKKLILSAALIMATVSFAIAQLSIERVHPAGTEVTVIQQEEWKQVELSALNEKQQAAVKAHEQTCDVKKIEYNASTHQAKVTLVTKADKSEKTVILDAEGKEVK